MTKLQSSKLIIICWCLASANALAQATPTDAYQRVLEIAAEVDLIRLEMGVGDSAKPNVAISGAQPREVYFQALTLFEKSNRLLFEQLRDREDSPTRAPTDATPDKVLALLDRTLELIIRVKRSFGITEMVILAPPSVPRTPTDVYKLIVSVNRTLNTLLQQRFAPPEVYQQLTYGVGLAAGILATFTSKDRLGTEPPFVRRKTPVDVYRQFIEIYGTIHKIMILSGKKCLVIDAAESERTDVSPSDVYDLASLLVAELSYLHSLSPDAAAPKDSYYPGDKLPSHVYQRGGRLDSQVTMLHDFVSKQPLWLGNK